MDSRRAGKIRFCRSILEVAQSVGIAGLAGIFFRLDTVVGVTERFAIGDGVASRDTGQHVWHVYHACGCRVDALHVSVTDCLPCIAVGIYESTTRRTLDTAG